MGCVVSLLNQTVSDYDSFEVWHFLVVNCCAELLNLLLRSVIVLLQFVAVLYTLQSLAVILFQLNLRVLMSLHAWQKQIGF